jgi:thiamine pyrophosphokinase
MNSIKALIIAYGEALSKEIIHDLLSHSQITIAADGGIYHFLEAEVSPQYIVGDLDTLKLDRKLEDKFRNSTQTKIVQVDDQNKTDLDKALELAISLGVETIFLAGVTGKRSDHFISNLHSIERYSSQVEITFYDNFGYGRFYHAQSAKKTFSIATSIGDKCSFFSLSSVKLLFLSGVKYPLPTGKINFTNCLSISNVALEDKITFTIQDGSFLVYHLPEIKHQAQ